MTSFRGSNDLPLRESHERQEPLKELAEPTNPRWKILLHNIKPQRQLLKFEKASNRTIETSMKPARWSLGILNDRETEQVPGKLKFLCAGIVNLAQNLEEFSCFCLHCYAL